MAGLGEAGWLGWFVVEGPEVEGFVCGDGFGLPDTLRRGACTGTSTGFDFGGGVPATVCRIVIDL